MLVRISPMNQSLVSVVSITLTSEPLQAPNMPTRPIPLVCSHDEHAFGCSWGSLGLREEMEWTGSTFYLWHHSLAFLDFETKLGKLTLELLFDENVYL